MKTTTSISGILKNLRAGCHDDSEKYAVLKRVLDQAFERASKGKGAEHHSFGEQFENQFILRGARRFGLGALQFQIAKKNEQICKIQDQNTQAKINEFLDIINYAAAAVILLEERARQTIPK